VPLRQQVVFLVLTGLLLLVILELVRRRRLRVEYSWVWLVAGASIVALILRYDLLVRLTAAVGAVVPTSTLFMLCILFLAALCLDFSVRLSTLTRQVKELTQELALLRHARERDAGGPPREPGHAAEDASIK
jgi:hypothetical protein